MGGGATKPVVVDTAKLCEEIRRDAAPSDAATSPRETEEQQRVASEQRAKEYLTRLDNVQRKHHFVSVTPVSPSQSVPNSASAFTPGSKLNIFTATWNMEGKGLPTAQDLALLLPKHEERHILAFASQECLRTIPKSFLKSEKSDWENLLSQTLGIKYSMLVAETLVATHIVVFVRSDVRSVICESSIESANVTTGLLGGNLGNKGGVGVSFVVGPVDSSHSVSLLFLSAHFSAHQDQVEERNGDYETIIADMKLGAKGKASNREMDADPSNPTLDPRRDVTNEFDLCFFMGDFNYRVNGSRYGVEGMLKGGEMTKNAVMANDQLTVEVRKGKTFRGFKEGEIGFLPTYKFAEGSDEYETKKMRIPSWTDRVLFKQHGAMLARRHMSLETLHLRLEEYSSVQELRFSDHRPVRALFSMVTPLPVALSAPVRMRGNQDSSTCSVM